MKTIGGAQNKELERTKSSQTDWGLRRSIQCSAGVAAPTFTAGSASKEASLIAVTVVAAETCSNPRGVYGGVVVVAPRRLDIGSGARWSGSKGRSGAWSGLKRQRSRFGASHATSAPPNKALHLTKVDVFR